jgi:predicted Rossmann fold nucleotide-binding protein DprA/Smf involved in DNA uptake
MFKEVYHPNAHLSNIKNIKRGLRARTKVLNTLGQRPVDAKAIVKETGMLYGVVMHHLRLLEAERIVERKGSKPHVWVLTGIGQKRLMNAG